MKKVYQELASRVGACKKCIETHNEEWEEKHLDAIIKILKDYLPHGSGFDSETDLNFEESSSNKLILKSAYHKIKDDMYDGWMEFNVIIKPSLQFGFEMDVKYINKVSKEDKELFDNYIWECFYHGLNEDIRE